MGKVSERGELDNTLIALSSDHGEMLGDHDFWGKSKPYQAPVGVPLVLWGQDIRRGRVCNLPATTMDLTATFLDYAGIEKPPGMDSRSMRDFLTGRGGSYYYVGVVQMDRNLARSSPVWVSKAGSQPLARWPVLRRLLRPRPGALSGSVGDRRVRVGWR